MKTFTKTFALFTLLLVPFVMQADSYEQTDNFEPRDPFWNYGGTDWEGY